MLEGETGAFRRFGRMCRAGIGLALIPFLAAGCAAPAPRTELALRAEQPPAGPRPDQAGPYQIGCPDIVDIRSTNGQLKGRYEVKADGRIDLGKVGRPRLDGKTTAEATRSVADLAGLPAEDVRVRVADYRSQQVYLVGEIRGLQRAVPYQGPERVADLLQRAGGLTADAAVGEVYLIRSHLIDGRPPEVVPIDLQAIQTKGDQRSNVLVQPFDQINVGESRQSAFARSLPPMLLPLYQSLRGR